MYERKIVRIPNSSYVVHNGQFGIKNADSWYGNSTDILWYYCREELHYDWTDRNLFFCHKKGHGKAISAFMARIEKKLKLKTFSQFGPTQRQNVSWIKVSPWWTKGPIRKYLFTILLRASMRYNTAKRNFKQTLNKERYVKETQPAVERFLAGYTRYRGDNTDGWCYAFEGRDKEEVKSLLY